MCSPDLGCSFCMHSAPTCRLTVGSPQRNQTEGACCIQPVVVRLVSTLSKSAARSACLRLVPAACKFLTNVAAMIAERGSIKYVHAIELSDAP